MYYFSFLCIEKQCTKFSFSSRCRNQFENGASDMDCAIDNDWFGISWNATEEEVSSCTTACLGGTEIGGIGVYIENHVGSSVSDLPQLQHAPIVKVLYKQANIGFAAEAVFFWGEGRGRFAQKKGVMLLPRATDF